MKEKFIHLFKNRRKLTGLLLVLPVIAVILMIVGYPTIYMFVISLYKWPIIPTLPSGFVGIENFINMFSSPMFQNSLKVTVTFVFLATFIELTLGLLIALLLWQERKGVRVTRAIIIFPTILAPVVIGLSWRYLLDSEIGLVNYFLKAINISPPSWLGKPFLAFISIVITDVWEWTPFMVLILLAGLLSLPNEPFEAAVVDGASRWQIFKYITLPLLIPIITVALLFRTLDAFKVFDTVYIMTYGGPGRATDVYSFLVWRKAFYENQMGLAAAMSIFLLVIVTFITQIYLKILSKH